MGEGILNTLFKKSRASSPEQRSYSHSILGVYNLKKLARADELFPDLTRDFMEMEVTLRRKQAIGRSVGIDITSECRLVPVIALHKINGKPVMDYYMEWRDKDGKPNLNNPLYSRRKKLSSMQLFQLRSKLAPYNEFDPENP